MIQMIAADCALSSHLYDTDLEKEFAVGVVDANGKHVIISSGPLPEAGELRMMILIYIHISFSILMILPFLFSHCNVSRRICSDPCRV